MMTTAITMIRATIPSMVIVLLLDLEDRARSRAWKAAFILHRAYPEHCLMDSPDRTVDKRFSPVVIGENVRVERG
jgi:hypothetical protein